MLLRHHPLMSYHGVPNWPPVWTWIDGVENKRPRGEIGILTKVALTNIKPANRCYLYIENEGSFYIGCLLFDDPIFCRHVAQVLNYCHNRSMAEIGDLDLSYLLQKRSNKESRERPSLRMGKRASRLMLDREGFGSRSLWERELTLQTHSSDGLQWVRQTETLEF